MGVKSINDYTVVVTPDDNGTFVAYIPAIFACHAIGATPEEARAELGHVFSMVSREFVAEGTSWPADVKELVAFAG